MIHAWAFIVSNRADDGTLEVLTTTPTNCSFATKQTFAAEHHCASALMLLCSLVLFESGPVRMKKQICPICKEKVVHLADHLGCHVTLSSPLRIQHKFFGRTQMVGGVGKFPLSVQQSARADENGYKLRTAKRIARKGQS
jgi:hypothetical protein